MKKIVIFLLAAILLVTCLAVAEQNAPAENETPVENTAAEEPIADEAIEETEETPDCPESYFISGYVMEIMEDGSLLILTNNGEEIVVHLHEETVNELDEILPGQFIIVDYNGMMTRSIPAQISADHLYVYSMDGIVTEVIENEEERYFLMDTELHDIVMVRLPEDILLPNVDMHVRVYFNGVMTLSLPGQINALGMESIPNELARGEIEITDEPIAEETETPTAE